MIAGAELSWRNYFLEGCLNAPPRLGATIGCRGGLRSAPLCRRARSTPAPGDTRPSRNALAQKLARLARQLPHTPRAESGWGAGWRRDEQPLTRAKRFASKPPPSRVACLYQRDCAGVAVSRPFPGPCARAPKPSSTAPVKRKISSLGTCRRCAFRRSLTTTAPGPRLRPATPSLSYQPCRSTSPPSACPRSALWPHTFSTGSSSCASSFSEFFALTLIPETAALQLSAPAGMTLSLTTARFLYSICPFPSRTPTRRPSLPGCSLSSLLLFPPLPSSSWLWSSSLAQPPTLRPRRR